MSKQLFFFFLVILLCMGGGIRLWTAWTQNQMALVAIAHLAKTTSCAVDEPRLQWLGEPLTYTWSPYLQSVVASALETELTPPPLDEWQRDTRIYYWFMAQTAVKNEAYRDSLIYLAAANAGSGLDSAGSTASRAGHPECLVINWTIASEIGYRESPDGYVQHMMNHEQWPQVVEAFNRLLRYDSQRADWRLSLAKAYVAMGETAAAEETLAPVLLEGTVDEIEVANQLLQFVP